MEKATKYDRVAGVDNALQAAEDELKALRNEIQGYLRQPADPSGPLRWRIQFFSLFGTTYQQLGANY